MSAVKDYSNEPVVKNLREYLRIRSVHPNINYGISIAINECLDFLKRKALELELPVHVFEVIPNKPVLVMTWEGLQPDETSILLNSHMDVVPVFEESWKYPPFEAKLVDGVIYGRGAQDMKSVAIVYLETIRKLKNEGIRLKRTVHLSFVPDEETGGSTGMGKFVETEHYRKLNVGFALDEGLPSATDEYLVYNGERSIWHINLVCPGKSGHGSLLLPDNCGEKIRYIIDKLMDLRHQSKRALANDPALTIGDVTSVNLTMLSAERIEYHKGSTKVDDSNPYWVAFKAALDKLQIPYRVLTFPGGTDSRYVRELGVPALGMSPLRRVTPALHEHNESVPAHVLLHAVEHYTQILIGVANV